MKKFFLFAIALGLCVTGFSQSNARPSYKDALQNPVKSIIMTGDEATIVNESLPIKSDRGLVSIDEVDLGQTYYDWQTNHGPISRTVAWPDGTLNACWTSSVNSSFSDRGTAVAYFDGTSWSGGDARIEPVKTGFGSIAKYGENGLVVAAHTASTLYFSFTDDHTLKGEWRNVELTSAYDAAWPDVTTSGENNEIVHVLAASSANQLYYYRSTDGGKTWEAMDQQIDYFLPPYAFSLGSNSYKWLETTEDNRISFITGDGFADGQVIYSDDNGNSWQRIQFYRHPGIDQTYTGQVFYPRHVSAQWAEDGSLHLAYEFNATTGEPGSGSYYPGIGGVAYWNDDVFNVMDTLSIYDIHTTGWFYSDNTGLMPPHYIGYLIPLGDDGRTIDPYTEGIDFDFSDMTHGSYNSGIAAMPDFFIQDDRMFCFYIALADGFNLDGLAYYRLFATNSRDGGETWTLPQIITTGVYHAYDEVVYPYVFHTMNNNIIRGFYQYDGQPGTFVQGDESVADDNFMKAFAVSLDEIDGIEDNSAIVNELPSLNVYPNPASSQAHIYFEKEAEIVVYNSIGQKVLSFTHDGRGDNSFDVSSLNSGVYVITAYCGNASTTSKLIVK